MMLTALKCKDAGIIFAAVHDSYWTHPSDINNMNKNMAACDINNAKLFYLPKKYFNAFNYLAKFYHENNILYKVPIPNILLALKSDENSKLINDRSIWLLKSKQMSNRKFICQSFIQKKIDYESKK